MIRQLRVTNFRLLRDVQIDFEHDVPTVFIGPNGSGKSTVLEVIDFLSRCATDGLQAACVAHGGIASFRTAGANGPVTIETRWAFESDSGTPSSRSWDLAWRISLAPTRSGEALVKEETLTDLTRKARRPLVTTDDHGIRNVFPEDPSEKPSQAQGASQLAFETISDPGRFPGLGFLKLVSYCARVVGSLSAAPSWARAGDGSSPRDSIVIGPKVFLDREGIGLANVLFNLFNDHAAAWAELESAFRGEFPFVRRLVFPPIVGGSKIAFAFEDTRFPDRKFFSSEMSDGMIAYLCLLASVLQPEQRGVLGLDEPGAHLHPSALRRFMSLVHRAHEGRHLAIVTHSNALLDELQAPERSIRVVEAGKDGATIRKLDAAALAAWRKDYSISEMRQTGLLDASNASTGDDAR
ncbi:MAG: AAA family ATPase [Deltaproteobacteria bacterium]|nr:AAA family ATPase [Deltaproteobacteria bacterium]